MFAVELTGTVVLLFVETGAVELTVAVAFFGDWLDEEVEFVIVVAFFGGWTEDVAFTGDVIGLGDSPTTLSFLGWSFSGLLVG